MTRLTPVDGAQFTPEQKALYESIASGPRAAKRASLVDAAGHLTGPFNAYLHLPAAGKHWSAIGEELRFRTSLDKRLFELVVLVVAVHWRSGHEWAAHARLALEAELEAQTIAALRAGARPHFAERDEEIVYGFAHQLVTERHLSEAHYRDAIALLGEKPVVELVNVLGYYIALAAMLNAFAVHPPKGLDDPWPLA